MTVASNSGPAGIVILFSMERSRRRRTLRTHVRMCQQLLHDEIVVDLPGEFPPLFRALELLVRFDLQCIKERILYGVGPGLRVVYIIHARLLEQLNYGVCMVCTCGLRDTNLFVKPKLRNRFLRYSLAEVFE